VVITHGNVLAEYTIRWERAMQPYLKYERWVHPVRFLNLLPLSHVVRTIPGNVPASVGWGGTVIFQEELKAVGDCKQRFGGASVSARECAGGFCKSFEAEDWSAIWRNGAEGGENIEDFRRRFRTSEGKHFLRRWGIFRGMSAAVWLEVLGVYLWRRGA